MFQDRLELVRRDREIKKPVTACAPFLVDLIEALRQTFEARLIAKIALMIENRLAEFFPNLVSPGLARKFSNRLFHFLPKFVIAFFASGETDHEFRKEMEEAVRKF